jgi:hypothetical protein
MSSNELTNNNRNIVKQKQDGVAPDPKHLVLQNPREMAGRPFSHQEKAPITPTTPIIPTIHQDALSNNHSIRRPSVQSNAESAEAHSIPLSCSYFASDRRCPDIETRCCRFLHEKHIDLPIADNAFHVQAREYEHNPDQWPKFNDPVIVCGFEHRREASCFRGTACLYAHWIPLKGEWHYHDHQNLKKKTCRFWAKGCCNKSAQDCSFAHELLAEIAAPPAGAKSVPTCPFWFDAAYLGGAPCRNGDGCRFAHAVMLMLASKPHERRAPRKCHSSNAC